jgi:amino acid transporter
MPVVMLADWILDPPRKGIDRTTALWWLAYPLAYAAYTLIRGPLAGDFYPYPFINPEQEGYGQVAVNCLGLTVVLAVLALAVAWLGNVRRG